MRRRLGKIPAARDFYFGGWMTDRVQFSYGRDVRVPGARGRAVELFLCPICRGGWKISASGSGVERVRKVRALRRHAKRQAARKHCHMSLGVADGRDLRYFSARLSVAPQSNVEQRLLPRVAQAANRLFCRTYHNVDSCCPQRIPRTGPAILVCNHVSGLDPMLIQSACSRLIIWMMAREYYEVPSLNWLYKLVEAIPVDRTGRDLAATRAALRALNQGRVVGIFPEGRIETDQNLLPFQTGVALMAIKTEVPVFPAYLDGTQRGKEMVDAVAHPNRAAICFGPPVDFRRDSTSKMALEHATERIKNAVWSLRQEVIGDGRANFSEVLRDPRPISFPVNAKEN